MSYNAVIRYARNVSLTVTLAVKSPYRIGKISPAEIFCFRNWHYALTNVDLFCWHLYRHIVWRVIWRVIWRLSTCAERQRVGSTITLTWVIFTLVCQCHIHTFFFFAELCSVLSSNLKLNIIFVLHSILVFPWRHWFNSVLVWKKNILFISNMAAAKLN